MTIECKKVIDEVGFSATVENIHIIEEMLSFVAPDQLVWLIGNKDPEGIHDDALYFLPWIHSGYIRNRAIRVEFDRAFWACYDIFDAYCDELRTFHFLAINQLKDELDDVVDCANRARIKSVPYIAAMVVNDRYTKQQIENNIEKVKGITPNEGVRTRGVIGGDLS